MAARDNITAEELRELMSYDPETGVMKRLRYMGPKAPVGAVVGHPVPPMGYLSVGIKRAHYSIHRLAVFYMTGEWPKHFVDHRNGDKTDNRWSNLRQATNQQNQGNMRRPQRNTSGLKGVSWHKPREKWRASITVNGRANWLGSFTCKAAAHFAYLVAADIHFGEFARAE